MKKFLKIALAAVATVVLATGALGGVDVKTVDDGTYLSSENNDSLGGVYSNGGGFHVLDLSGYGPFVVNAYVGTSADSIIIRFYHSNTGITRVDTLDSPDCTYTEYLIFGSAAIPGTYPIGIPGNFIDSIGVYTGNRGIGDAVTIWSTGRW